MQATPVVCVYRYDIIPIYSGAILSMVKLFAREKALEMRARGTSIGQISRELGVSKSTVSLWCKNIALSQSQIEAIHTGMRKAGTRALLLVAEKKRAERMRAIEHFKRIGAKDVGRLSKRDLFILGLGLYWGEGYKNGSEETGFTNSDPGMIRIFVSWLCRIYGIQKTDLIFRISINQIHSKRIDTVMRYWTQLLGVSKTQFTKTSLIKSPVKKLYKNNDNYYGVLRVKVRNGVNLRRRILGSLEKLKL